MKIDRISGLFWIAFSLYIMYSAYQMELGSLRHPGTGFFPFVCASLIFLMAVLLVIQTFIRNMGLPTRVETLWKDVSWRRPIAVCLIMLGYILIVEWLGFGLTAFLMVFLLLKAVEKKSLGQTLVISIVATAVCHVVFNILLKSGLPRGILGF